MKPMAHPFQSVAYIQIRRRWLGIQVLTWSGKTSEWSGVPEVVLVQEKSGQVRAYWPDDPKILNRPAFGLFTAFSHSRVVIDRLDDTQRALDLCLRKAGWKKLMSVAVFVLQIQDEYEGGLSEVERRGLVEVSRRLGAHRVLLLNVARHLSAPEVLQIARSYTAAAGNDSIVLDVP